jgi:zinc transporter, ZIP family
MVHFFSILAYAFIPVCTAVIGGLIATFRPPSPHVRSYIQHTAAGVVFSVVAVELLPDIVAQHSLWIEVAIGFTIGVISMLAMRQLSHTLEKRGEEKPMGILVGVGVDITLDGFLISISFAAGPKEGLLLTIALALELLSLGLAVATALGKTDRNRARVLGTTALLFLMIVVGAGIGALVLSSMSELLLEVVLSFGLAALLYLVTEELLVEAHKEPESPMATGMFFVGFLIFLVLGMVS